MPVNMPRPRHFELGAETRALVTNDDRIVHTLAGVEQSKGASA